MRAVLLLLLLAGCVPPPPPAPAEEAPAAPTQTWTAVLVAGDGSLPVFDNATVRMQALLEAAGTPASRIHRLSAAPATLARPHVQIATRLRVVDTIAHLQPAPGEACFVYLTSHGAHGPGVYLAPRSEFLSPAELDAALQAGCGSAPTVAIVSACYTGDFAQPPMTRPNRIILTAASADRPSFGCGAGREFAYYDQCLLQTLADHPADWAAVIATTGQCVTGLEQRENQTPSLPQSAIGEAVATLPPPGR